MFYSSMIEVIELQNSHVDDNGVWIEGKPRVVERKRCDIQPMGSGLAYRHYGYDGDVKYEVYSEKLSKARLGSQISLNGNKKYKVVYIEQWDEYDVLLVSDKHDS